jgi:hypothetical protein
MAFKMRPIIAAIKMMVGSFIFLLFNSSNMVAKAIIAVGMSVIVRITMTITALANAPMTAAVMPPTKAFTLGERLVLLIGCDNQRNSLK